ncbi:hypothetical protein P280DRAFT_549455 [Massarina eburnea CBS 473.64]|uniref:Uncharacterized protein n=1 Tax=Massarina eburnea CBS 473.64 TaxID=1395130 RepID=A0A6A6S1S1_9PLEO|nr:hypothetical protein P280DRAFT_549455 [Massarina eburnea CBS 473.64]
MPKANTTRRSRRLLNQRNTATKYPTRKSRPNDSRKASATSASSVDLDALDAKISTQLKKKKRVPIVKDYLHDSTSEFSTDNEDSEEDEYSESASLSADNFEWLSAEDLDSTRHSSLDSLYESDNKDYEKDDFVAGDDEEIEDASSSEDEDDIQSSIRRISAISAISALAEESRRSSSGASKLFYSDSGDASNAFDDWMDFAVANDHAEEDVGDILTEPSAEIVEDILDAMAVFSRRCNRNREPVRFRLASAVLRDQEVKEALENAERLGLGRKVSLADGSKRWTIGPKKTQDLVKPV